MGTTNFSQLFPGRGSFIVFITYMSLFVNQGILVTWSQTNGKYNYNTVTVVLMTEVLKLLASVALYYQENSISQLFADILKHRKVLMLYMIPSCLYCLYNNLSFVNLENFDPTTYFLLLQLRVVITGIIFQVVFKKQLSNKQWISLILLTFGCIVKHLNLDNGKSILSENFLNIHFVFILIQTVSSCLAGVYNEYLLKGEGANINIFLQNSFMYIDSIVCNIGALMLLGKLGSIQNVGSLFTEPKVLLIMINNAAIGIVTSFFLKNLNSILKTFASALELMFTAILCWILFNIPIHLNTVLAISIVSTAVILYSQNPVDNTQKTEADDEEKQKFLSKNVLQV